MPVFYPPRAFPGRRSPLAILRYDPVLAATAHQVKTAPRANFRGPKNACTRLHREAKPDKSPCTKQITRPTPRSGETGAWGYAERWAAEKRRADQRCRRISHHVCSAAGLRFCSLGNKGRDFSTQVEEAATGRQAATRAPSMATQPTLSQHTIHTITSPPCVFPVASVPELGSSFHAKTDIRIRCDLKVKPENNL